MRHLLYIVMLAISVLVGLGSPSSAAPSHRSGYIPAAPQDLYCLQGRSWGYPGNCQFSSYSQCMATASGTYAYCGINPMHAFARHGSQSR
ncbi:DUF3551 domain-containing protein [Bradyrhizobium sp. WSM471]|uniref:DUF3551 domain-containing protein n=2 Tax=Bradyrhizobium sp. WSM471 TaxID=319017 RepID=UPI00024D1E56|nr:MULTISPECIES: DUF3551 domain-containing protein [Bradyrhizobium]EHR01118.1 Protein of unknown function (DUF3551) [Bradyrhizobium sp. WSM471]UFW43179.1 DUF3551 domain-containing protein [Bradyrhizobium canariense]